MSQTLNQKLRAVWLPCLMSMGAAGSALAYPPPDDGASFSGGLVIGTTGTSASDVYVGFQAGGYVPVYASDGDYQSRVYGQATLTASVYLLPLLSGDVTGSFRPLRFDVGFNADTTHSPGPDYTTPSFTWSNSASLTLTSSELAPEFRVTSSINPDLTLGGSRWLHFELPGLEYSYSSRFGESTKLLGVSLDLFSNDNNCNELGCEFNKGIWSYSVTSVPEPEVASLSWAGLLVLGGLLGARRVRQSTPAT
jgi:hypothetical protein